MVPGAGLYVPSGSVPASGGPPYSVAFLRDGVDGVNEGGVAYFDEAALIIDGFTNYNVTEENFATYDIADLVSDGYDLAVICGDDSNDANWTGLHYVDFPTGFPVLDLATNYHHRGGATDGYTTAFQYTYSISLEDNGTIDLTPPFSAVDGLITMNGSGSSTYGPTLDTDPAGTIFLAVNNTTNRPLGWFFESGDTDSDSNTLDNKVVVLPVMQGWISTTTTDFEDMVELICDWLVT